jgi:hypothetical protein
LITGFLAQLRARRRPLIAVSIALVVLQTLVAGLAAAQAAARLSASPFDPGVICHGAGGADPAEDGAPWPHTARDLCCAFCAVAAPAMLSVTAPMAGYVGRAADQLSAPAPDLVSIARYAVRAGPSQAPPSFA